MEVHMSKTITFAAPWTMPAVYEVLAGHIRLWLLRRRHRTQLRGLLIMGPQLIADMGMTMEEARREVDLPFWRSPVAPPLKHL
jgi:uncharacterized protein YjiS (DUF1127 family)